MSMRNFSKHLGRWGAACGLVLAGLALSGCQTQERFADLPPTLSAVSAASPGSTSAAAPAPPAATTKVAAPVAASGVSPMAGSATNVRAPEPNVFRVGDALTIVYADLPTPPAPFEGKIKEDGTITLLLNQPFTAAGKTAGELEREIRDRYVPKYFKQMTVTVKTDQSAQWYYVDGEVRQPTRQVYTTRITVLKAIASAGGFTDFAKKTKVQLTRLDGRTLKIDCNKALKNPALDLEVYPGDTIHVPRRLW